MKKLVPILILAVVLITFFAVGCESGSHTVEFYVDGSLYEYFVVKDGEGLDEIPDVPSKDGKNGAWDIKNFDEIKSDLKVTAIYTDATFKVTFIADGTIIKEVNVRKNSRLADIPAVPEKTGFVGSWSVNDFSNVDRNITAVAEYTPIDLSVKFIKDGDVIAVSSVEKGGALSRVPEVPEFEGKNLNGKWVTENGEDADFTEIQTDITVYAYYYAAVELLYGESEVTIVGCDIETPVETIEFGVKPGYDFGGWYADENFRQRIEFPHTFTENTAIYCRWHFNGGSEGFTFVDGKVTGYVGSETDVTVPYKYVVDGKETSVTGIADGAFDGNTDITSITLPSTVTEIGAAAFRNCANLKSVGYSDGCFVERIGDDAFNSCISLKEFTFSPFCSSIGSSAFYMCSAVTEYKNLSDTLLQTVPAKAFYGNEKAVSFALPACVEEIGESAFAGSVNAEFIFEKSNLLKTVGSNAFENCYALIDFTAPSIESVGENAFKNCRSLTSAYLPSSENIYLVFGTQDDIYFYECEGRFVPQGLYSVTVTKGTGSGVIPDGAFKNLYSVKQFNISEGISAIGKFSFAADNAVWERDLEINLPQSLVSIGDYAFSGRTDLISVLIPRGVEEIGEYAFYGLSALNAVTTEPNSALTYVGREAFGNTKWFDEYSGPVILGRVILGITERYLNSIGKVAVTAEDFGSAEIIAPYAFYGNRVLRSVTIPETVYGVYRYAFADCDNLTAAEISAKVIIGLSEEEGVPSGIFAGSDKLTSLTIGAGVRIESLFGTEVTDGFLFKGSYLPRSLNTLTLLAGKTDTVGKGIYDGLSGIKKLVLSEGLTGAEDGAFVGGGIEEVYFPSTFVKIGYKEDADTETETVYEGVFSSALKSVVFAENSSLEYIYEKAFYGCGLTGIAIPATVKYVGKYAFADSVSSEFSLTFADGALEKIDSFAFANTRFKTDFILSLPDSLVNVGESAFVDCANLVEVKFGSGIKTIGENAFKNSGLKRFDLSESVECFDENGNVTVKNILSGTDVNELILRAPVRAAELFGTVPDSLAKVTLYGNVADGALENLPQIKNLEVVDAEIIGSRAFYGCGGLIRISLPITVKEIGDYACAECGELATFIIESGNSLKSIGEYVFRNDTKLRSVVLPSTIENTVLTGIFYGCERLENIGALPEGLKEIGEYAFYNCSALNSVVIPTGIEKISDFAFFGCSSMQLRNVKFDLLTEIGADAFNGCAALYGIKAQNIKSVGERAFYGCGNLKEVSLSTGAVSQIADERSKIELINLSSAAQGVSEALTDGCTSVRYINLFREDTEVNKVMSALTAVENTVKIFVTPSAYANLSEEIKNGALKDRIHVNPTEFDGTYEFNEVDLTAKLTSIGNYGGEAIYLPAYICNEDGTSFTVTALGKDILKGNLSVKQVIVPCGIKEIEAGAFYGSAVTAVRFETGSELNSIGAEAFRDCRFLTEISLPDSVKTIGERAFYGSGLTAFSLSAFSELSHVGEYAFYGCAALKTVEFASSAIESIGRYAFAECGLVAVTVNKNAKLNAIKEYTFKNCYGLSRERVILPDGTEVDENAFAIE